MNEQYRMMQAITGILAAVFLIDLRRNQLVILKSDAEVTQATGTVPEADGAMRAIGSRFVAPEYRARFLEFTDLKTIPARLEGKPYISFVYQRLSGRWYDSMLIAQTVENGVPVRVMFTAREITDEKKREAAYQLELERSAERARRADAVKTEFLRNMSHDIRTPINGIRGMVEIGNRFPEDMRRQQECRDAIWTASGYLLELVNDVLDMSRLEAGKSAPEVRPFRLRSLLRSCVDTVEGGARQKNVALCLRVEDDVPDALVGSAFDLQRILVNVLSNAVRYNREGGSVELRCGQRRRDGETTMLELTCADTGIGMSEEFQRRAFDLFAQEGADARSTYRGTGLGLAIAKELTEQIGGAISFVSKRGEGTTFTITVPMKLERTTENAPAPAGENAPAPEEQVLNGISVLLAEDNDLNMQIAQWILEQQGAAVTPVRNGQEALDAFIQSVPGTFDVILMDLMMPVMDGLEAARQIRGTGRPDAGSVAILAMTANTFSDDMQRTRNAGMNCHLAKPLDARTLIEAVRRYGAARPEAEK